MNKGDTVIVDQGHANGGYQAEVIWVGNLFARIRVGDRKWDIMKARLTKKPEK